MKPKRIFRVFQEVSTGDWRWHCRSAANKKRVFTSGEAFASKWNATQAAKREMSLMAPGVAVLETQD